MCLDLFFQSPSMFSEAQLNKNDPLCQEAKAARVAVLQQGQRRLCGANGLASLVSEACSETKKNIPSGYLT